MSADVKVVNVRLPKEVLKWLDKLVKDEAYNSRSEILRDLIREYVREHQ